MTENNSRESTNGASAAEAADRNADKRVSPVDDGRPIKPGMGVVGRAVKRCFDATLAGLLLLLFSPLYLICYILVKREDGGAAIYKQERIGKDGKPFNIYKFRSMRLDAEKEGPQLYNEGNDPRLTKVGKFLREHHLDELPQLWNVLKGEMSIVGYRPEREFFVKRIMAVNPQYALLYRMRPGLFSNATLYNGYTDTMEKMLERLRMDLDYARSRTMWVDIKIIYNTTMSILTGKKF